MKKRIDIYGTLEFPLAIGCAAFIKKQEAIPFGLLLSSISLSCLLV